jgi:hypothetical protein
MRRRFGSTSIVAIGLPGLSSTKRRSDQMLDCRWRHLCAYVATQWPRRLPSHASAAAEVSSVISKRTDGASGSLCSTAKAIGRDDDALYVKFEPVGRSSPRCHAATRRCTLPSVRPRSEKSGLGGPIVTGPFSPLGLHALMPDRVEEIDHRSDLVQRQLRPRGHQQYEKRAPELSVICDRCEDRRRHRLHQRRAAPCGAKSGIASDASPWPA